MGDLSGNVTFGIHPSVHTRMYREGKSVCCCIERTFEGVSSGLTSKMWREIQGYAAQKKTIMDSDLKEGMGCWITIVSPLFTDGGLASQQMGYDDFEKLYRWLEEEMKQK